MHRESDSHRGKQRDVVRGSRDVGRRVITDREIQREVRRQGNPERGRESKRCKKIQRDAERQS